MPAYERLEAPLVKALEGVKGRLSFHMPAHKGKAGILPLEAGLDLTELSVTDNLYDARGPIREAQRLAALSAHAAATLFLTNGSTCGVEAMLCYAARTGDKVILPRASHMSAISACALYGLTPVWVDAFADGGGAPFTPEAELISAIKANPDAACVLVTRPDYYGRLLPLAAIAAAAHEAGMLLIVDEAHGAHMSWLPAAGIYIPAGRRAQVPAGAMDSGADICVQSAHKTLPALTGGAYLHCGRGIDAERLCRCVALTQSSSPSFLIMASLDAARAYMDKSGAAELARAAELCEGLNRHCVEYEDILPARMYFDTPCDRTRLALDVSGRGITGFEAMRALEAMGIDAELADGRRLVMIASCADASADFARLKKAISALPHGSGDFESPRASRMPRGSYAMSIRRAALGDTERVPLAGAAGHVAARAIGAYPPGVPVCVPGERISQEIRDYLLNAGRAGADIFGMESDMCVTVRL